MVVIELVVSVVDNMFVVVDLSVVRVVVSVDVVDVVVGFAVISVLGRSNSSKEALLVVRLFGTT